MFKTLHNFCPEYLQEDNATGETSEMMAFVKNWKNIFERRFVERMVRPFVMTAEGDTIICTRYMTPIQPPDGFLHEGIHAYKSVYKNLSE